jgi:hypothetical protein
MRRAIIDVCGILLFHLAVFSCTSMNSCAKTLAAIGSN